MGTGDPEAGYAHTWTVSTPVPALGRTDMLRAQPLKVNGCVTIALRVGASNAM